MSYGSKQYWAMCIFPISGWDLYLYFTQKYLKLGEGVPWGDRGHVFTGKEAAKNNNSSRGFHLLAAGSDENMSQHMNRPGLAIGVGDSRTGHTLSVSYEGTQLTERKEFFKRGKKELLVQPGNILPRIAHPRSPRWNINVQFVYLWAHIFPALSC